MYGEMSVNEWNDLAKHVINCPKCGNHVVTAEQTLHRHMEVRRKNGSIVGKCYDSHYYVDWYGPDENRNQARLTCRNANCNAEWDVPILIVAPEDKVITFLERIIRVAAISQNSIDEANQLIEELKKKG